MFRYAKSSRQLYSIWTKLQKTNSTSTPRVYKLLIARNFAARDGRPASGKGDVFRKPTATSAVNKRPTRNPPPTKQPSEATKLCKIEIPKAEAKDNKLEAESENDAKRTPISSSTEKDECPSVPYSCPPPKLSAEATSNTPTCPTIKQEEITTDSGCKQAETPKKEYCPPFKAPEQVDATPTSKDAGGGRGGGDDKMKWLFGILALALAGAVAVLLLKDKSEDQKEGSSAKRKGNKKSRLVRPSTKVPASCEDLPKQIQYLLIGGGTASSSAFRAIKSLDPKAKVLIITQEPEFPYMRPPLSKEMWNSEQANSENLMFRQWNGTVRSVFFEPESFYMDAKNLPESAKGGVAVARGWTVTSLDALKKEVTLDDGSIIAYEKCLLAPGSKPKAFPLFDKADDAVKGRVFTFRDVFDYRDLSSTVQSGDDVVVIGGGFLGSELACSLSHRGVNVTQVFREPGLLAKVLPKYLSSWLTEQVRVNEGVNVLPENEVTAVSSDGKGITLTLANGKKVDASYAILATGAVPNTDLAETSKLETHPLLGGYLVNSEMQSRSNLYVAGDAACFYDERFGRRRIEHHDHAVVSGRLAGENMVGAGKPYQHTSMLWSDLSPDIGWEGVGILDPSLITTGVFAVEQPKSEENKEEKVEGAAAEGEKNENETRETTKTEIVENYNKGVVFYLKNDIVVGILLWNIFNRLQLAKQVLRQECKYEDLNELAKLFKIHSD